MLITSKDVMLSELLDKLYQCFIILLAAKNLFLILLSYFSQLSLFSEGS